MNDESIQLLKDNIYQRGKINWDFASMLIAYVLCITQSNRKQKYNKAPINRCKSLKHVLVGMIYCQIIDRMVAIEIRPLQQYGHSYHALFRLWLPISATYFFYFVITQTSLFVVKNKFEQLTYN